MKDDNNANEGSEKLRDDIVAGLSAFGYEPGEYVGSCRSCNQTAWGIDKRTRCCWQCAVAAALKKSAAPVDDGAAAWCVSCGGRYTAEEIANQTSCPGCGSVGVPCDPKNDIRPWINWHELRIMAIWATNWAQANDMDAATIQAISIRLQGQYPKMTPLSIFGEVAQLKSSGWNIETNGVADPGLIAVNGPGAVK